MIRLLLALCALPAAVCAGSFPDPNAVGEIPPEVYQRYAIERQGNPALGKILFHDDQRLMCGKCHSTDGAGFKAGPDLFSAGDQFSRRELVEAVLHPSARIAVGYSTTIIETSAGDEYTGILKNATDAEVELALPDGQRLQLQSKQIQSRRGSTISLMPDGLHLGLSPGEFCDLVEYVVSLKENPAAIHLGMPEQIPPWNSPIHLRPLLDKPLLATEVLARTEAVQTGLVSFAYMPSDSGNLFLAADQSGILWRIAKGKPHAVASVFVDLSGEVFSARGPNGLLGLAFHPEFERNRKYYLKHQALQGGEIVTRIVERVAMLDLEKDSGLPSRLILEIEAVAEHHNGGCLTFGPDGYLYIGMGDSAPNHDPQGHGQALNLLLGKMLRLDVNRAERGRPYAIPEDNPFRHLPEARPEIWALGLREPWRFSFDTVTGDLWVADLGQERGDEITIVRRGENHGWNVYEGFELFSTKYRRQEAHYVPPIFSTRRRHGAAIVGGFVYRGGRASPLYGSYIFGDHVSKKIWALQKEERRLKAIHHLGDSPQSITAFAQDAQGQLYLAGYQGMIYQIDISKQPVQETRSSE